MGKTAGFAMILAGVGTAAYVVPTFDARDRIAESRMNDVAAIRVSAPSTAAPMAGRPAAGSAQTTVEKVAPAPAPIETGSMPAKASDPIKVAPTLASPRIDQRTALTKDIQRELTRVGCYAGDIDGEWSAQTRQAMKTFVDRVNATLPIEAPDHILKTLVSGHPGDACGKTCPAGQSASNGRCMPTQIHARTPRNTEGTRSGAEVRRVTRNEKQDTAIASAPKAKDRAGTTQAIVSSWAPTVVAAPVPPVPVPVPLPRTAPAMAAAPPVAVGPAAPVARPDLPGRMSVGVGAAAVAPPSRPLTADAEPAVAPAKAASKIVIRKRDGAVASLPGTPPAAPVPPVDALGKGTAPVAPRQQVAATDPSEPVDATAVTTEPRKVVQKRGPDTYAARAPAPRFVGMYVSPPSSRTYRPSFGPSVFKRLERDGR